MTQAIEHEPVPPAERPGAGSLSSPATSADAWRVAIVVLLLVGGVQSFGAAMTLLPFVPVLLALRLVRSPVRTGVLLGGSLAAAVVVAVVSVLAGVDWAPAASVVAMSVGSVLLTVAHVRGASEPSSDATAAIDPPPAPLDPGNGPASIAARPEPAFTRGLFPTIGGWALVIVAVVALAAPGAREAGAAVLGQARDAYAPILQECEREAGTRSERDTCLTIRQQRDWVVDHLDDRPTTWFGVFLGLLIITSAASTHGLVLLRTRQGGDADRTPHPVSTWEVHWSSAYVLTAGIAALFIARSALDGAVAAWVEAAGAGVCVVGASLIAAQGLGLAVWLGRGRKRSTLRKVLLGIALFILLPYLVPMLFGLGVLDAALRPRRRNSGTLPRRGI